MADEQRNREGGIEEGDFGRAVATMRARRPPADVTARMESRLAPLLGPSGPDGTPGSQEPGAADPAASVAGKAAASAGTVKAVALAAVIAVVGTGAFLTWERHQHPDQLVGAPIPNATSIAALSSSGEVVITREVEEPAQPEAEVVRPAESVAARPRSTRLEKPSEAYLLTAAKRTLETDPESSLGLLRRHAEYYPNGMLRQEREVLMIEAQARLGEIDRARRKAEDFLRDNPDSAYGTKVRESVSCDGSADHKSCQ